jgi:hypothetical protein
MYRYLESAPPDWKTPARRRLLEESLGDKLDRTFGPWGSAGQVEKAARIINLAILLAQRLFSVEVDLGLWPRRPGDGKENLRRGERYLTSSVTPATPPPFAPHLPVGLILSFKWVQPWEGERYRRLNAIVLEGDSPPPRRVARRASVEAHLAQRLSLPPAEAVDGPRSLRRLPLAEILYELHGSGAENPRHPDHSRWLETLEAW